MADLVTFDGVGLANGAVLAAASAGTGDTAVDAVSGDSITKVTTDPDMADAFTVSLTQLTWARWVVPTNTKNLGLRYYFKRPSTWPGAALPMMVGFDLGSTTNKFRAVMGGSGQPGQVRLSDDAGSSTGMTSGTGLYALGDWVRMEMYVKADPNGDANAADGLVRGLAYIGHNTAAIWDTGWLTKSVGVGIEQIRLGAPVALPATPGTLMLAHLKVTDTPDTLIGPWAAPPSITMRVKRPDTGAVVPATIKGYWDGTTLHPPVSYHVT